MLKQIHLEDFPSKYESFRPQILGSIKLLQKRTYDQNTNLFYIHEKQQNKNYQLYITHKIDKKLAQNIQFIQNCPNILLLTHQPYHLVIQEQFIQTLEQYMSNHQSQKKLPYLNQNKARQIIQEIAKSLLSFNNNKIDYNCISQSNIIQTNRSSDKKQQWKLSLAGLLTYHDSLNKNYYDKQNKTKQTVGYALGTLLFKMLFGFVPYENNCKKPDDFNYRNYIVYLQKQQKIKKMLKIYYFAQRIQMLSQSCKTLISQCLTTEKIRTVQDFLKSDFFHNFNFQQGQLKMNIFEQNREIKMINYFDQTLHSIIMASIEYKNKNPYEKINIKVESDTLNFIELRDSYKIDPLLGYLQFAQIKTLSQLKLQETNYNNLKIDFMYFYRQFEQQSGQNPTFELLKLILKNKKQFPNLFQQNGERQSKIKLYAYPYVMIFELINVYREQPIEIKKKIEHLIPYLFNVSSLHWPIINFQALHSNIKQKSRFEDIKYKYRELINSLYKHFLMEAMKRYNCKKLNLAPSQQKKLKDEGLHYYKLCLKLMQASVLIRKKGYDLDLQRIQTSQRKQIQQDLQNLLKTYFPNRVQIK